MSRSPRNDDGEVIHSKMGRPSKGDLTDSEFAAIVQILSKPRKARGGSLEAAAKAVSDLRGANVALTPATVEARKVSARWVSHQLSKRGIPGKKGIQAKVGDDALWPGSGQNSGNALASGPRTIREFSPEESSDHVAGSNLSLDGSSTGKQVVANRPEGAQ